MPNAIVLRSLIWLGLTCAFSQVALGNEYASSQVPPNQPLQIRTPQEPPAQFPPLAQAIHVEEVPPLPIPGPLDQEAAEEEGKLSLPPPSKANNESVAFPSFSFQSNKTASIAASLLVVIGLFLAFAWVGKKNMKPGSGRLSKEIIQVLGKSQLSGKQQLELVRVGQKLLLLCVTQHGVETLTEITDPGEVERLITIVRKDSPTSMSTTFQDVLTQMGQQPARGFLET